MATILVVDDAAFVRVKYGKALSAAGHTVVEARDGEEALKKYRESRPDGVLLDTNMPGMDGLVTLHKIMEIDSHAQVAMVTAMGTQSIVLTAIKAGARDFVIKPTSADGVVTTVSKLLASASWENTPTEGILQRSRE